MSKAQRRKGNAQCASSGQAAELLQNTGNFVPLLGLEGVQISLLEGAEQIVSSEFDDVSPEIRIVLKKLSKRDALTREKGIKEILEVMEKLTAAELKPLFTCFSTIYPRLVTDSVPAIRLSANNALLYFLKTLRKDAEGTALKTIMPFLLFSLGDTHAASRRVAERLLDECFVGEKRCVLMKTFAKPAINLALEFVSRRHKFVQPQYPANSDETNEQRQSRLVAQALLAMELLLDENERLAGVLIQDFTQSSTITALSKISTNIKVALFSLLKRLIQIDAAPFFDTKILTLILGNLDSAEVALCRNTFDCFLMLGVDARFRDACKFEKAVVPKFLAMIRKKTEHWNVLETSLLPSFSIIVNALPAPADEKWTIAAIDSFFDGHVPIFLLSQWSTAFVEVVRYSVKLYAQNQKHEMLSFLRRKTIEFIDYLVDVSPQDEKLMSMLGDFIVSLDAVDAFMNAEFKHELAQNIFNKLPQTDVLARILLVKYADRVFLGELFNSPLVGDELLITALHKHTNVACESVENVGDFLLKRICESNTTAYKVELLRVLCSLIVEKSVENQLNAFVKNNAHNCLLFIDVSPKTIHEVFNANVCAEIVAQIFDEIVAKAISFQHSTRLVQWTLELASFCGENAKICAIVLEICLCSRRLSDILVELYAEFYATGKINAEQERIISTRLFKCLMADDTDTEAFKADRIINLFNRLHVDSPKLVQILREQIQHADTDPSRLSKMAKTFNALKFVNASVEDFLVTPEEVCTLANNLERMFLLDILAELDCFMFSFVPTRPNLFSPASSLTITPTDTYKYLCECVKIVFFNHQVLYSSKNYENADTDCSRLNSSVTAAARGFIMLIWIFVDFYYWQTFSLEERAFIDNFLKELNHMKILPRDMIQILRIFLPAKCDTPLNGKEEEVCIPISVIFALKKLSKMWNSVLVDLDKFFKELVLKRCPTLAYAFALNFSKSNAEMPILLAASNPIDTLGAYSDSSTSSSGSLAELCSDSSAKEHSAVASSTSQYKVENIDETTRIRGWIYEFERACATFNSENRLTHFITLKMFLERNEFSDWLFILQGENLARDSLSCVLLRFCTKIVPYIAEIEDALCDFIYCSFITALQSCADYILLGKSAALLFVLAQHSIYFFINCEKHIYSNAHEDKDKYAKVRQEWTEFFSPSAITLILTWFLNLAKDGKQYPYSFVQDICRSVHFFGARRIFDTDLWLNLSSESPNLLDIVETYFQGYPSNRRDVLCSAARLLLSDRCEIQFAATKILQSYLLFMFDHENAPNIAAEHENTTADASSSSNHIVNFTADNFDVDESEENEMPKTALPKFFAALLHEEYPTNSKDTNSVSRPVVPVLLLAWDAFVCFVGDVSLDASSRLLICEALSTRDVDTALERILAALPDPPAENLEKLFVEEFKALDAVEFNMNRFVCNLYYRSLINVPALVRQWYLSLGKSVALAINRYTRKYVSPLVVRHEISRIGGASSQRFGRLNVRVLSAVNEIVAAYRFDDATISLHVALPSDFPLSLAVISTQRKIVREELHRKWLLQLDKFLSHENGSLLDGIMQWKRNIDKHLEGVDDCTICMLTVSLTNHQLPRIRCRQCRNKFHGDCLYKWFKTSSNTSCPLCRANFVL